MKNKFLLISVLCLSIFFSISNACCLLYQLPSTMSKTPTGFFYSDTVGQTGIAMLDAAAETKKGEAIAYSFLNIPFFTNGGLVALGDAGLTAAMKNGNITKCARVEYGRINYLLFETFTTTVYGE